MTDWKQVAQVLSMLRHKYEDLDAAFRLCTAASRLPAGVDAVRVLEDWATTNAAMEGLRAQRDELEVQVAEWEMTAVREGLLCAGDIER